MAFDVGGLARLEGTRAGIGQRGGALAVDGVGKGPVEPGQRLGRTAVAAQPCAVVVQRRALLRGQFRGAGVIAAGALVEIGRAAWRERVGQYVEISVVAVSLKKKTK